MQTVNLKDLVRPNIWALEPYSCARSEFKGEARFFLDANENPFGEYNRYPDPLQVALKEKIAKIKGVRTSQIMLGNGSDEPIDLIYRIFCRPGVDNVVAMCPTYGMYKVAADTNDVEYREAMLEEETFALLPEKMLALADQNTKVMWVCSPNNPTGNLISPEAIETLLNGFGGILVVDEAYIDFADSPSWLKRLDEFPRLIVLQTFSKAWGLAGLRCGMAFASEEIIAIFNKVKYPYNINMLTQKAVSEALDNARLVDGRARYLVGERKRVAECLTMFIDCVEHVYPSDANFLLVKMTNADAAYAHLLERGVVTRNRNRVKLCGNCLRITIGDDNENDVLIAGLVAVK